LPDCATDSATFMRLQATKTMPAMAPAASLKNSLRVRMVFPPVGSHMVAWFHHAVWGGMLVDKTPCAAREARASGPVSQLCAAWARLGALVSCLGPQSCAHVHLRPSPPC